MDVLQIADLASDLGVIGVCILVIWGLLTGRMVPKGHVDELRKEIDECHREIQLERARHDGRRE